tara:strand:+ start:111 stop:1214 length:1104 start_codon:yes stop_codon:yes gene_type:complete
MGIEERYDKKSEKYLQSLVLNDKNIHKYIIDNLGLKYDGSEKFEKGKKYLNNLIPDFKITKNNEIIALVECKGANINVTDYVRGLGQLAQYESFWKKNIKEKETETYSQNFKTIYLYPSEVIKNNDFKKEDFIFPETTICLEINLNNNFIRELSNEQISKFTNIRDKNKIKICEYYYRDNRLYELYILLIFLKKNFNTYDKFINRTEIELKYLRKYKTVNNRNWRNAWISLSGMGFLTKKNNLSEVGKAISNKSYYEFCSTIFFDYYRPYFKEIFNIIKQIPNISLQNLMKEIRKIHDDRDVLFVTDSDSRYVSSWLNMFRDDFGFIDFLPRNASRNINYDPLSLTKEKLIENIKKYNKAENFIKNL